MIKINCATEAKKRLIELVPFQGDLKLRTEADVTCLGASIREEGLIMPFAIWENDGKSYLLDGHGRRAALMELAVTDTDIMEQEFPVIPVEAETEEEARKRLLQIVSQYGKVTKNGLKQFTATIPTYKHRALRVSSPVIKAFPKKKVEVSVEKAVVRIRIDAAKMPQLIALLKQVNGLEVL
jgi:hypothetical protein